jgi:hypothetical protein
MCSDTALKLQITTAVANEHLRVLFSRFLHFQWAKLVQHVFSYPCLFTDVDFMIFLVALCKCNV